MIFERVRSRRSSEIIRVLEFWNFPNLVEYGLRHSDDLFVASVQLVAKNQYDELFRFRFSASGGHFVTNLTSAFF